MRFAFCAGCLALLATGCGGHRSSDAAFRARANGVCRDLNREKRSLDFATKTGFARGLAEQRAGVERLARLHPAPSGERAYRELLAKLRDVNARLEGNGAELLRLERRLRASSGRAAAQVVDRFRALVGPVARDALQAEADARVLQLGVCATGLAGGAPLGAPLGGSGLPA